MLYSKFNAYQVRKSQFSSLISVEDLNIYLESYFERPNRMLTPDQGLPNHYLLTHTRALTVKGYMTEGSGGRTQRGRAADSEAFLGYSR